MKIRIKFAKTGVMKICGSSGCDALLPESNPPCRTSDRLFRGLQPAQLLSFASPLGVGISSTGEYFDMVLAEDMKTDEIVNSECDDG